MRHLLSLLLTLVLVSASTAQDINNPGQATGLASAEGPTTISTPVLQYCLAFLGSAGVLVLVCMPARRS
jgi:hypothetical protein